MLAPWNDPPASSPLGYLWQLDKLQSLGYSTLQVQKLYEHLDRDCSDVPLEQHLNIETLKKELENIGRHYIVRKAFANIGPD
jgi:hypothetical protein